MKSTTHILEHSKVTDKRKYDNVRRCYIY